jgi:plasmid stabilization system protein ParE
MPRLIVTEGAARGLDRCRAFLADKNPLAAARAGRAIASHLLMLEATPHMGRPFDLARGLRELPIPFGDSGHVALYRHEPGADAVHVVAIRHQREAGYRR